MNKPLVLERKMDAYVPAPYYVGISSRWIPELHEIQIVLWVELSEYKVRNK